MSATERIEDLGEPRPLRRDDVEVAARAVARAFSWHEPWGAWVLPDTSTREETLVRLVRDDLLERFLDAGLCSTIGGLCVTLWIPPPSEPGAEVFSARRGEAEYAAYGERAGALRAGDELLDSIQPEGEYWYLDTIATEPAFRSKGLGSRLLAHDLAAMDERGSRAALDTHTPENVAFYRRHGFELIGEDRLPEGGPDLYLMLREPS